MMKIPETSANVGAYYGNEENGQWQPNGVIIDNGVGGGVVGSGDAGMHRAPVYPVHIPRGHVPTGYVMTGPYYGAPYAAVPPPQSDDFSDYMWMENEEEFDKQVLQQLEEEALMEQCIEAMLEDEQRERRANRQNRHDYPTTSNGPPPVSLEEAVSRSTLNPLAAEFVPTRGPLRHTAEEKPESTPPSQPEAPSPQEENSRTEVEDKTTEEQIESKAQVSEETKTEEAATPPKDPPEVSAADIHPTSKLTKKEVKKQPETKRPAKTEVKKKPLVVKSEPKIQPKKKEVVKPVKSEAKVVEKCEEISIPTPVVETIKPQTPTEEVQSAPGLKPINYAAAAKASKPKPKSTTPPIEKPTAPAVRTEKPKPEPTKEKPRPEKTEKKVPPKEKTALKEKVNVQRKNSAK